MRNVSEIFIKVINVGNYSSVIETSTKKNTEKNFLVKRIFAINGGDKLREE